MNAPPVRQRARWLTDHGMGMVSVVAFLLCFFGLIHQYFPVIGHDYGLIFAELLEGKWWFDHFGLGPPRYAPHLCGGSVFYGHPLDMFYSPAQFLALRFDPWIAVQATILTSLLVGYVGWYRVGRNLVHLPQSWSHLLALVILANGFHFLHLLAGHFTYHAFPLLGWLLWLVLDQREDSSRVTLLIRAAVFALLSGYILYSGNWFVLYLFGITFGLALPLDLFWAADWRRRGLQIGLRAIVLALAAASVMASKLIAISSFTQFFPRRIPLDSLDPSCPALLYVLSALWRLPQGGHYLDAMPAMIHEKGHFITPVALLGLALAAGRLLKAIEVRTGHARWRLLAFTVAYGTLVFTAMIHLVRGSGIFAEALHALPIAASQHVSSRYLYPFALLISVAGVCSLANAFSKRWNLLAAAGASAVTVLAFVVAHGPVLLAVGLTRDVNEHRDVFRRFDSSAPISNVVEKTDFLAGTGRRCYEPILNQAGDPMRVLHVGPVTDRSGSYLNLMNPACYQYPRENGCLPGDRIAVSDSDNLFRFTHGLPVTWQLSRQQRIADAISTAALVVFVAMAIYGVLRRRRAGSSSRW